MDFHIYSKQRGAPRPPGLSLPQGPSLSLHSASPPASSTRCQACYPPHSWFPTSSSICSEQPALSLHHHSLFIELLDFYFFFNEFSFRGLFYHFSIRLACCACIIEQSLTKLQLYSKGLDVSHVQHYKVSPKSNSEDQQCPRAMAMLTHFHNLLNESSTTKNRLNVINQYGANCSHTRYW